MKKLLMLLILGMFLISLVSAENVGVTQQSKCIDIIQTCTNCSYNKISSLYYPDNSHALGEVTMTKTGTYYNYAFCNTSIMGTYKVAGYGDDFNVEQPWSYYFDVTADGNKYESFPIYYLILIISFVLIFISYFFDRLRLFKYAGSIMIFVIGVLTLYPGYNYINWTTLLGKTLGTILICLGFYFLIEDSFSRDKQPEGYEGVEYDDE
jgi:hypothetical protein